MGTLLITGFPGFLGAALLPKLLARRAGARAVCLVQDRHMDEARARLALIEADNPGMAGRVDLVAGDITVPGLGLPADLAATEVWHLAAVYDLSVDEAFARKVNVDGTANVLARCAQITGLKRLHYVSTCYVSGRYDGRFTEEDLDVGQSFQNHYEATKFEAERLVRAAMADGLPATIYRPGIVVGDSATGETQKYDGPYFVLSFLRRQPKVAFLPELDSSVKASMVPRDFVIAAMDELSVLDKSQGKTYALTDPSPPDIREAAQIMAGELGRRIVWLPIPVSALRAALDSVPGLEHLTGLPAESLDYFTFPTTYDTSNADADLAGTGVQCPAFASYAGTLLRFMLTHPEFGSEAMV